MTKKNDEFVLFYSRAPWKKKRLEILARDNNECQMCKDRRLQEQADVVHHIKHLRDRPDLALVDDNLVSLCNSCHNEVHPEKLKRYESDIHAERWE